MKILGVLLAGGQSRRMGGGDKCLRDLGGETVLSRIIGIIKPQVSALVLNANGDAQRFSDFGLPVTPDVVEGFAGPLAGVLTGMEWAAEHADDCTHIATVPTDAPFIPGDLIDRLADPVANGADMSCAASGGRDHPVIAIWPVALRGALRTALVDQDVRKVDIWTADYDLAKVDFPTDPIDPFFNVNRPEDMARAEEMLAP